MIASHTHCSTQSPEGEQAETWMLFLHGHMCITIHQALVSELHVNPHPPPPVSITAITRAARSRRARVEVPCQGRQERETQAGTAGFLHFCGQGAGRATPGHGTRVLRAQALLCEWGRQGVAPGTASALQGMAGRCLGPPLQYCPADTSWQQGTAQGQLCARRG